MLVHDHLLSRGEAIDMKTFELVRFVAVAVAMAIPGRACRRDTPGCVPGVSASCACPGGAAGVQTCSAGGTFGACACAAAPAAITAPTVQAPIPPPTAAPPAPVNPTTPGGGAMNRFAAYPDVRCTAQPTGRFHLRPSATNESVGPEYTADAPVGVVSVDRNFRNGARLFLVRVADGGAGHIFLQQGELAADCPAEFATSITQARCITPCASAYQTSMAHCEDGCAGFEEIYGRCLQQCGTSLDETGLPGSP